MVLSAFCKRFLGILLLVSAIPVCLANDKVSLVDGWVRASLPGVDNSVAFLTLRNNSEEEKRIVAVSCTVAKQCELHQHIHREGKMRMERVEQLSLPPNGTLVLASGGYHVMLLGLVAPLAAGSTVELVFTLADQSAYPVVVPVKSVRDE